VLMSLVSPLHRAIFDGDCKRIDTLLAGRDANMRSEDCDKWNLLHIALVGVSREPRPEVVRHLIELGVDVNARDRRRWTPLHFAARTKNPAVVKLLIEAGADVNAKDDEGITPLHQSLLKYPVNLEMTEMLLAAGAKTDMLRKYVEVVASPVKDELLDLLAKYDSTYSGPASGGERGNSICEVRGK
jgi:ankyrin repeat protein